MLDTLSFRIFLDHPLMEDNPQAQRELVSNLILYTMSNLNNPMGLSGEQITPVVTCGLNKDTGRDHLHLHICYLSPLWHDHKKAESDHRKAWFKDNKLDHPKGQYLTMTLDLAKDENQANDHLGYVFKEGLVFPHPCNETHGPKLEFLIQRGMGLYEAEKKAARLKANRATKAKNICSQILEITERKDLTLDYLVLRRVVLNDFYSQFTSVLDYPNSNDVKNAWQKVALFKRVVQIDHFM